MKVDMSPKAITARLKQTSELRRLCLALAGNRLRQPTREELRKASRQKTREVPQESPSNSPTR